MAHQKRGARAAAMILALLLGVLGAISFARRLDAPVPSAGVTWVQAAEGPLALEVDPEGAAARSGVLPGDVLIRVDGAAAPSALDAGSLPWDRADGATLELLRGSEIIRTVLAPPQACWRVASASSFTSSIKATTTVPFSACSRVSFSRRWPKLAGWYWASTFSASASSSRRASSINVFSRPCCFCGLRPGLKALA